MSSAAPRLDKQANRQKLVMDNIEGKKNECAVRGPAVALNEQPITVMDSPPVPPNERTPLLRSESTVSHNQPQSALFFCDVPILPCVQQLKGNLVDAIRRGQDTISPLYPHFPQELQGSSAEMGHFIICLLALREEKLVEVQAEEDPILGVQSHSRSVSVLDKNIMELWKQQFPDFGPYNFEFMEGILWTAYPLSMAQDPDIRRVIDYLHTSNALSDLACHPAVMRSILRTWRSGLSPTAPATGPTHLSSFMLYYDSFGTPRVSHTTHLLTELVFFIILADYLVNPPSVHVYAMYSATEILRDTYILFYSLSNLFFSRVFSVSAFVLVILAFLLSYPQLPIPGFSTFSLLTLAFLLRLCQYHLACSPSPVFLLPFHRILPLVSVLSFHASHTLLPVLLFFIPVILFVFILLAFTNAYDLDTRLVFAIVLLGILLLFVFFLFSFAPSSASQLVIGLPSGSTIHHPTWDRYSQRIGLDARKSLIRCASIYGAAFTYPPPFNLLQLLIVTLPRAVLAVVRTRHAGVMSRADKGLWRVTVGPFALVLGSFWSYFSPIPSRTLDRPVNSTVP
jgi:hypothetical protein